MIIGYYKYYKEIKNRLLLSSIAWTFCLSICYIYREAILFGLVNSNNIFINTTQKPYFIFTNITEVFYVYIELAFFIANQIGLLALIYHFLMFLSLGLYRYEFLKLKLCLQIFSFSWTFSTFILYYIVLPFSWDFFLSFQKVNDLQPLEFFFEAKIEDYFGYFKNLYYLCLVNCQFMAVLIVVLTSLNEQLKKTKAFRKLFYLIFVTFSTIISPPDIISQICLSFGLIILYESLILLNQIKLNMVTN